MKFKKLLFTFFLISSICLNAQTNETTTISKDSTTLEEKFGGPTTIQANLKANREKKQSYFRIPIKVTKSWYDWKKEVSKKTGINFGMEYIGLFMKSSDVKDENVNNKKTQSGVFDVNFSWNVINRDTKNKGTIAFKMSSRHAYGDLTAPMFHGINESGYYGLSATGYNDYTFRMLELHYSQYLFNGRIGFIVGKIDPSNYYNFHGLAIPSRSFIGYGAMTSGTINMANPGMGVGIGIEITKQIYFKSSITDVYGDLYSNDFLDFGQNFFDGNFSTMSEIGWAPTIGERYFKNFSLTYWHTPGYVSSGDSNIQQGSGIAFSSHWFFNNKYIPFLRFGISDGNGENAFYKKDFQIGNGFYFKSHDLVGIAFSWAEPNISNSKDQLTGELFYRTQITEHLAITPDLQWIHNPTLNPTLTNLYYFGLRARVTM